MIIAGVCCVAGGLLFLCIGLGFRFVLVKSKSYTGYTDAEVISVELVWNGRSRVYKPVLYYSVDGEEYTKMMKIGHNPPKYKEGDIVTIRYDELNPRKFCIDGDGTMNLMSLIFIVLGAVTSLIGLILLVAGGLV